MWAETVKTFEVRVSGHDLRVDKESWLGAEHIEFRMHLCRVEENSDGTFVCLPPKFEAWAAYHELLIIQEKLSAQSIGNAEIFPPKTYMNFGHEKGDDVIEQRKLDIAQWFKTVTDCQNLKKGGLPTEILTIGT